MKKNNLLAVAGVAVIALGIYLYYKQNTNTESPNSSAPLLKSSGGFIDLTPLSTFVPVPSSDPRANFSGIDGQTYYVPPPVVASKSKVSSSLTTNPQPTVKTVNDKSNFSSIDGKQVWIQPIKSSSPVNKAVSLAKDYTNWQLNLFKSPTSNTQTDSIADKAVNFVKNYTTWQVDLLKKVF